jgi:NNMT/PNMT/TEMT family
MASVPHSALNHATNHLPSAVFSQWDPATYLVTYYSQVEAEERHTLRFLTQEAQKLPHDANVLEFGIGPTLHHMLPFAQRAREIHVADLLPENLEAVRQWCMEEPGAFNWHAFTREVLICEGVRHPVEAEIQARERLVRERLTRRLIGDARLRHPLGAAHPFKYDCVVSCYCADSATANKHDWFRYLQSITSLLAPGGQFIVAALRNCSFYQVGELRFPSARIDEHDLRRALALLNFEMSSTVLRVCETPEQARFGFQSIVLASTQMK